MTDRETNIRSVLFLVIGILLLLSLVICIYIVSGEKDLVEIDSTVIEVKKDANGTGKNEVTVVYDVDGTSYEYNFYSKEDVNVDDKVPIFYHSENATSVTTYKVPKIIFICPVIGLVLCILGLYELFKKNSSEDGEEEFKTSVIGVVGNTQQLKIVADDAETQKYEKTSEEKVEPVVKTIKKVVTVQTKPAETDTATAAVVVPPVVEKTVSSSPIVIEKKVEPKPVEEAQPVPPAPPVKEEIPVEPPVEAPIEAPKPAPKPVMVEAEPAKEAKVETPVVKPEVKPVEEKPAVTSQGMTDAIVKKVQSTMTSADSKKVTIDEDDIKQAIKDVLKEVIAEVKEEKTPPKKVEQRRVLPNYYYISGTSLIYEEAGKEAKEISLKTVKKVVRTVNSEGNVVKLIVSNDEIKCILTNMKNIDLEQVASLLNNKMRTIDETFKEEVEYKEY